MTILDSLIDSIVRLDGDTLVLHAGDKPYVIVRSGDRVIGSGDRVTGGSGDRGIGSSGDRAIGSSRDRVTGASGQRWSQVELSAEPMQADAIWRLLRQILPAEQCRRLQELGAADYDVHVPGSDESMTLTAVSTSDDDLWVEVRRTRREIASQVEAEIPSRSTVVPMARSGTIRQPEVSVIPSDTRSVLLDLLRAAAAQGATQVYLGPHAAPMIRVAGRITLLRHADGVVGPEVEQAFVEAAAEAGAPAGAEWTTDVPGVGCVRGVPFVDDAGAGVVFELPAQDARLVIDSGLEPAVRALADCSDGLVVVAGPRGGGKSTLLDTFVDLINRSRADHVIVIGTRVRTTLASRGSFISQRAVQGDAVALGAAARAALREGPDVIVLDLSVAPEVVLAAIDAARTGRLVFLSVAAPGVTVAVSRLLGGFTVERQPGIRAALGDCLRAIVSQVLLERNGGGRIAAREVLLGSPAVAQLIARGVDSRLPLAMQAGRRAGMKTLEESLVALVRSRAVSAGDAIRVAHDPASLTRALQRENLVSATGA